MEHKSSRWPDDRLAELGQLKQLLFDAASLNTGNCVIERMERMIETANKLLSADWGAEPFRPGFLTFLEEIACPKPAN